MKRKHFRPKEENSDDLREDKSRSGNQGGFQKDRDFKPGRKKKFGRSNQSGFNKDKKKGFDPRREKNFKPGKNKEFGSGKDNSFDRERKRPFEKDGERKFRPGKGKAFAPKREGESSFNPERDGFYPRRKKGFASRFQDSRKHHDKPSQPLEKQTGEGLVRLNKYLANAGICSRREADAFIEAGVVKVNGEIITQLGYKVKPGDKVQFGGDSVKKERNVYILLNKPKGYITTCDDPQERDTVLDLIQGVEERVYPVGRLDRNTSGLLVLTNDGDLAKILMHPRYNVPKIYNVVLDKPLTSDDFDKIQKGIGLEDGFIKVDEIAYVDGADNHREIGVRIHSGKNRIIRRIFESLGYRVDKLDRVLYASLTKKNLPRGKWRFLEENEVRMLKRIK